MHVLTAAAPLNPHSQNLGYQNFTLQSGRSSHSLLLVHVLTAAAPPNPASLWSEAYKYWANLLSKYQLECIEATQKGKARPAPWSAVAVDTLSQFADLANTYAQLCRDLDKHYAVQQQQQPNQPPQPQNSGSADNANTLSMQSLQQELLALRQMIENQNTTHDSNTTLSNVPGAANLKDMDDSRCAAVGTPSVYEDERANPSFTPVGLNPTQSGATAL